VSGPQLAEMRTAEGLLFDDDRLMQVESAVTAQSYRFPQSRKLPANYLDHLDHTP
jgi:hypothetical protein